MLCKNTCSLTFNCFFLLSGPVFSSYLSFRALFHSFLPKYVLVKASETVKKKKKKTATGKFETFFCSFSFNTDANRSASAASKLFLFFFFFVTFVNNVM